MSIIIYSREASCFTLTPLCTSGTNVLPRRIIATNHGCHPANRVEVLLTCVVLHLPELWERERERVSKSQQMARVGGKHTDLNQSSKCSMHVPLSVSCLFQRSQVDDLRHQHYLHLSNRLACVTVWVWRDDESLFHSKVCVQWPTYHRFGFCTGCVVCIRQGRMDCTRTLHSLSHAGIPAKPAASLIFSLKGYLKLRNCMQRTQNGKYSSWLWTFFKTLFQMIADMLICI